MGDENEAYESSPDEPRARSRPSRKDEDMYDSIFDLRQCDSYDVIQKRGPLRRLRSICRRIAESRHFIHFIMISILVNMICMGLEHYNQPEALTVALEQSNILFVSIFSLEMIINMMAYGIAEYLSQALNVFDCFVVVVSIAELLVNQDYARLSVFRSIRLLRIFKIVRPVRYQLLVVIRTMNSVVTFFGLLFLFMFAFSILGMNLFGGKFFFYNAANEKVLRRSNFDTFLWAMVTVFQILTQENWNQVMYDGMRATNNWAALYFISLMIVGYYVLFNLLVAILVEGFTSTGNNGTGSEPEEDTTKRVKTQQIYSLPQDTPTQSKVNIYKNPNENDVICDRENCYEYMSRDTSVEYCGHAVRNAFWSKAPLVTEPANKKGKSISRFMKKKNKKSMDPLEESSDHDAKNLTMPELKQQRQTSIGLIKRTCMKPGCRGTIGHQVITGDSKSNPSYIPDDNEVNNVGSTIKLHDDLFHHRRLHHKKLCLKRTTCSDQVFFGNDRDSPVDLVVTDEAAIGVITASRTPTSHASRKGYDIREIEDIVPVRDNKDVMLQIDRDPEIENDTVISQSMDVTKKQEPSNGCTVKLRKRFGVLCTRNDWSLFLFPPDNKARMSLVSICGHKMFDYIILVFILMSCVVLAMEGPVLDNNVKLRRIIDIAMVVFTVVFTVEMMMKVIAMGFVIGANTYLKDGWNVLDFILVLLSWLDVIITYTPQASADILGTLKVFRALRTLRPLRMIRRAPGLKLVVQTLLYSLKPIGNTVLIAAIFFAMFGILGVQLFKGKFYHCEGDSHVINRAQCLNSTRGRWVNHRYNFDNLLQALISLFVVSTRDGWVEVMHHGIDAVDIDMQPRVNYAEWCLVYFIPFLLLGGFLVLNMIVGVVVENFQRCREKLDEEELQKSETKVEKVKKKPQDDLVVYFIHYNCVRRYIHHICMHQYWDITIAIIICLNVICMSMEHYQMPSTLLIFVETSNYFFTAVFVVEVVLKVIALGCIRYIKDRWNIIDLIIVVLSISGILLDDLVQRELPINPTVIRTLRVLRIVRVLKLVKLAKGVRSLLDTLFEALPQVANLGLLFLLLFFIYSCLGIQLFGSLECSHLNPCQGLGRQANFNSFSSAMLTLFRIATGDNWNGILKDTLRSQCDGSADCSKNCCISKYTAPLYFVTFVLSAQFVLVNVVIAVLMKHLKESKEKLAATLAAKNLEKRLKVLSLIAKNFIRSKASRKPSSPITRRRSVVELGLGGIELAQLKNYNKEWMDESFVKDVVKADAIFQQFIQLNNSLRNVKMKAFRTTSNSSERASSDCGSARTPNVRKRRHTLSGIWDLKSQDSSPKSKRIVWKSGCSPL